MIGDSGWWRALILTAWAWIGLVVTFTFWKAWEIPARLPEINEIATSHLFLFPVSLLLFLSLSWIRQRRDQTGANPAFSRWRATLAIWILILLHPVSCGLYPALFDLDSRTVQEITRAVGQMSVGMSRAEVERRILALNETLPIPMRTDEIEHSFSKRKVARYLTTQDPIERQRLWQEISQATLVFVPMASEEVSIRVHSGEQLFRRRIRTSSDIGKDTIRIRYEPERRVAEIVYSSNRQLTEVRGPCTIHLTVPAPPEMSFPYPCPR